MVDISPRSSAPVPPHVLRLPAFRRLWANLIVFAMVTNAARFAFIVVVVRVLQRSESWAGLVGFTIGLPVLFFVLQAGALADRLDRKRLLVGSQIGILITLSITAGLLATDQVGMGAVIVLTLVAGLFQAVGQPVRLALVPAVVPRERLLDAIALNAVGMTTSIILGPASVEIATELWGPEGAFASLAVLTLIGLIVVAGLEVPRLAPTPDRGALWPEIRAGIAHVGRDRPLRALFSLLVVGNMINAGMVMTLLPSFVSSMLGHDPEDAGTLLACMGLGLLTSSLLVMRLGSLPNKGAVFMRSFMVGSACLVALGLAPSFAVAGAITLGMGLTGGFYTNMNQTLVQSRTPDALMGRVMSLYSFGQQGLMPVGALLAGLVAAGIGLRPTFVAGGLVSLAIVAWAYLTQRELRELA